MHAPQNKSCAWGEHTDRVNRTFALPFFPSFSLFLLFYFLLLSFSFILSLFSFLLSLTTLNFSSDLSSNKCSAVQCVCPCFLDKAAFLLYFIQNTNMFVFLFGFRKGGFFQSLSSASSVSSRRNPASFGGEWRLSPLSDIRRGVITRGQNSHFCWQSLIG